MTFPLKEPGACNSKPHGKEFQTGGKFIRKYRFVAVKSRKNVTFSNLRHGTCSQEIHFYKSHFNFLSSITNGITSSD